MPSTTPTAATGGAGGEAASPSRGGPGATSGSLGPGSEEQGWVGRVGVGGCLNRSICVVIFCLFFR